MTVETHDLTMPAFGADMATGTLIEWQVKEGDEVKRGDVIAVIETNKGAIELDIFEDTVIEKLLVEVGAELTVGTAIAKLSGPAPQTEQAVEEQAPEAGQVEEIVAASEVTETRASACDSEFVPATPAARRLAAENNFDISELAFSKKGPVTLKDLPFGNNSELKQPVNKQTKPPEQAENAALLMRQAISDTVTLSKQTIPHYYLSQRLDITELQSYLTEFNSDKEPEKRLLLAAPILTAVARLLVKHKALNGLFINGEFVHSQTVHLAHAVNIRGKGLIMPVIRDAQTYDAVSIMQIVTKQVEQARRGMLPMSQLTGATSCVSSIGERGAEQMSAIILPPQVSIIAMGSPHQEPLVIDGRIEVRDVIVSTMAADHRVSDGHVGAKFLYQLNQLIQKPEQLWTVTN